MVICFCKSLTEKHIKELIDQGATSLDDIIRCCSACLSCGQCQDDIIKMLEQKNENISSSLRRHLDD